MAKRFKLFSLFLLLILVFSFISSFAYIAYANYQEKQDLSSQLTQKANSILGIINPNQTSTASTYNLKSENFDYVEKQISNSIENIHYFSVNTGEYTMKFDYSTKELLSLTSNISPVIVSYLSKDSIQEAVQKIYTELELPEDYSLVYTEKFSDTIWELNFAKMYGNTYNKYESVKIFYYPGESKILSLKLFNEPLNNETTTLSTSYTEEDYIQKAVSELNLNINNIHSSYVSIEKANNYYGNNSNDTSVHEVFVINENLEKFTRVIYVDINTCEIVGGDQYLCLLED